jgi:ribonuclease HIII
MQRGVDSSALSYIGTDESGKGDYFGPLVIAAVCVTPETKDRLLALDVKDSKTTSDNKVRRIADSILAELPHSVVVIGSEKYNELYAKIRNLNRLLAWGHARTIENILEDCPVDSAITDQFGDPGYVKNVLMKKGRGIELIQETKGERHIGVAAASIIARARFLDYLERYSRDSGVTLPKGAGLNVDQAAAEYCRRHGAEALVKVAKLHFKNTRKVDVLLGGNTQ